MPQVSANDVKVKYATREKNPTNDDNMIYYSETFADDYTVAVDGETSISFVDVPIGAKIIQVELEIKPLIENVNWTWNSTSRILTLIDVNTYERQLISILYKIIKTEL